MSDIENMHKEDLVLELEAHGVSLHHSTGVNKLRKTLTEVEKGIYKNKINTPDPKKIHVAVKPLKKRVVKLTREQRAMRLRRIILSPNDPLLSSHPGMIFTVGSSTVNGGRMIKKFVPFNNDAGFHVPQIIYDTIINAEMQKFKTVKRPDGQKVLVAYLTKKYNVTLLPDLTHTELKDLAAAQSSRGDT